VRVNNTIITVARDISDPKISLTNILNALKVISGNAAPFGIADAQGKKAKNKNIQSMLGNILTVVIMTLGKTAPFEMADALGKKAKNKSIQSMLGNILIVIIMTL